MYGVRAGHLPIKKFHLLYSLADLSPSSRVPSFAEGKELPPSGHSVQSELHDHARSAGPSSYGRG